MADVNQDCRTTRICDPLLDFKYLPGRYSFIQELLTQRMDVIEQARLAANSFGERQNWILQVHLLLKGSSTDTDKIFWHLASEI